MTIGLSEEDRDLRDSVRGWAARHATPTVVREAVEPSRGFSDYT